MIQGLTNQQAEQLLKEHGFNEIAEQKHRHILLKLFDQLNNVLTILLLGAGGLSFIVGESFDAFLILGIVLLNGLFGLYQEGKAQEAVAALKKMTVLKTRIIRDGKEQEIESRYLVPGDVVMLEAGAKVPADGIVHEAINFAVNEAALTGESLPVEKVAKDEVYLGTIVSSGRSVMKVTNTGMRTKFGEIAAHLSTIIDTETPLQKKLKKLTRFIGVLGILAAIFVFILSYLEGVGYFPSFLLAISLAVAVVPEGLPAVMTITLSLGVKEMSKKGAIVRKLSAIEALGGITLIATDKTGTLTTNKMKVKEIFVDGRCEIVGEKITPTPSLELLILDGILCSTASLVYVHDHGRWDVLGDPTEGALLFLAQDLGRDLGEIRSEWKTIEENPFDSVTKLMSVTVQKGKEKNVFVKGAPESVLKLCASLSGARKKAIEHQVDLWARKGLRVLAFGYNNYNDYNRHKNYTFLGLVAIHDSPRPEVYAAVKKAKEAGIKTIMITGDNPKTAEAIGVSVGIIEEGDEVLTGEQISKYTDEELLEVLPRVKIFARTSPVEKHRIVKLYQQLGETVVVTGDGVNDAIALKQADVGVAMGLVGTDVARETADMVITDDNFATIVTAIEEGRNIIKNLKNAIIYLLACNVSEALALVGGLALKMGTIFSPIQLLFVNLITDGIPALTIAFSPKNEHVMRSHPGNSLELMTRKTIIYIGVVGVCSTALILGVFHFMAGNEAAKRTAAFTVLVLTQSFIFIDAWLSHRSLRKSFRDLFSPVFLLAFSIPFILQAGVLLIPAMSVLLKVTPMSITTYGGLIFISSLILLGVKLIKKVVQ